MNAMEHGRKKKKIESCWLFVNVVKKARLWELTGPYTYFQKNVPNWEQRRTIFVLDWWCGNVEPASKI